MQLQLAPPQSGAIVEKFTTRYQRINTALRLQEKTSKYRREGGVQHCLSNS